MKQIMIILAMFWTQWALADIPVHEDRNEAEYNNQFVVVLNGYDPVSYFPEGGGTPVLGQSVFHFTYGTRMYYFSSEQNLNIFKSNPLKYEPTYGSWCAWAMANGSKFKVNPLIYTLNGERLHFFVSKSAKESFDENVPMYESIADSNWLGFSGEKPRR